MAWGGKAGRMTEKQRKIFLRTSHRRLAVPENPHGVPKRIMKALSSERLPNDCGIYNVRLRQLLEAAG